MDTAGAWAHVRAAFRWSSDARIEVAEVLAAALGMAVPTALGALTGQLSAGFAAALGALAVGRVLPGSNLGLHIGREAEAFAPLACAALLLIAVGGQSWFAVLVPILAIAVAATVGGYSRPLAVGTMRFVVFVMIMSAISLAEVGQAQAILLLPLAGAAFTSALCFTFGCLVAREDERPPEPAQRMATAGQKFSRWKRTLKSFAGWSYPIRLTSGVTVGLLADRFWSGHHLHWIGLTVALLTPRTPEFPSVNITQRALGTAIGVAATGIALQTDVSTPLLVLVVGLLACARPLLRDASYLAYSAVTTPLIILIMDAGRPPAAGLLAERLLATLIGAALVLIANVAMRAVAPPSAMEPLLKP